MNETPIASRESVPTGQMAISVCGDEPTFNADGYPTEETEQTITEWPFENGYHSLLAYVARAWTYPDYFTHDGGSEYKISTGGLERQRGINRSVGEESYFLGVLLGVLYARRSLRV